jgi:hypothetical protein
VGRRLLISCLVAVSLVSVSLLFSGGWNRPLYRLVSTALWVGGLTLLWLGAATAEPRPWTPPNRPAVGPPLSPEVERLALAGVLIVALALRFVLLAQVPSFIANDESMFSFEICWRPEYSDLYGLSLLKAWPVGWCPNLFAFGWNGFPALSFVVHWWGNAVAVLAAFALSLNIEHLYWSRIALNNIDAALLSAWALAALAWALDTRSWRAWVALGYALGFGFHAYHTAKLHLVLAALVVLVLAIGRLESWSRADGWGVLLATLTAALVIAPLVPDIVRRWTAWYGTQAGRLDISLLLGSLWRGDFAGAYNYISLHATDTVDLFRPAPVMLGLFVLGSGIACWRWKDPRYLTALLWMGSILIIGSATVGWRSARLVGALPVMSLMPALVVGHTRAALLRRAPAGLRRVAMGCGVLLLLVVLYESWWVEFVWRAQFRNSTFGICHAIQRLPLPATIFVAGTGDPYSPAQALHTCTIPDDPRRQLVTISTQTRTAPELGGDPNVVAIVFPDRLDILAAIRRRYPDAIEEPYLVSGRDPYGGFVPGAPNRLPGTAAFYLVHLRSVCPAAPLLQTYNPCGRPVRKPPGRGDKRDASSLVTN